MKNLLNPQDDFSMEDVADVGKVTENLGFSTVGKVEKRKNKNLKVFSKDQLPYMQQLQSLRDNTHMGFSARGGKGYERIINHFEAAQKGRRGFFAVNSGNPAGGQVKALIDLPLTDTSLGLFFGDMFIGDKILTPSPVMMRTGHVGRYGSQHNNPPSKEEALTEGTANVQQTNTRTKEFINYKVGTYALKDSVSPDDYMNELRPFNADEDVVISLRSMLMMMCEIDIAEQLFNTAGYPTDNVITLANATDRFDDPTSSIDKQVAMLRNNIRKNGGVDANTAVMDKNTFESMSRHPQARGTIFKDVSMNRTASEEEVRKLLQVDRLFIGKTSRATGNGVDAPLSRVWGKGLWMGYVNPMKRLRQPNFGFYHHFRTADSFIISRQSVGNPVNKELFAYQSWQHHIVDKRYGGMIQNAIS